MISASSRSTSLLSSESPRAFSNPVYPFNNHFLNADRPYSFEEQWHLVQELGFDKYYLSVNTRQKEFWDAIPLFLSLRRTTGLGISAFYLILDPLVGPPPDAVGGIERMLTLVEPGDTVELALTCGGFGQAQSDSQHDPLVIRFLEPILAEAARRQITISLYHHFGFWMEKIDDCVRIASAVQHPNLKVTFCGFHWYAMDNQNLAGKFTAAAPYLHRLNLCGSRPLPPGGPLPKSIETLDQGELDNRLLLKEARRVGFTGDIGFQGYGLRGDPRVNLTASLKAYRAMIAELST